MKTKKIEGAARRALRFSERISDEKIEQVIKNRLRKICKPCWELKYCPYGRLVELSPVLPILSSEALEHIDYLKRCLKTRKLESGAKLTKERAELFKVMINNFEEENCLTKELPKFLKELVCKIFGHVCPVYSCGEDLTETKELRSRTRKIPRGILIKVIKRDGQICQNCFKNVPEEQIEIDHIIPVSKGGPTKEDNLRILCFDCNRAKLNSINEIIDEAPLNKYLFKKKKFTLGMGLGTNSMSFGECIHARIRNQRRIAK